MTHEIHVTLAAMWSNLWGDRVLVLGETSADNQNDQRRLSQDPQYVHEEYLKY